MFEDGGDHHGYDTAQICLNGHVVNPHHESHPGTSRRFCQLCGAPTVTACPNCDGWLPGLPYRLSADMDAPAYCSECGKAYPWHSQNVAAAEAYLSELDELDENDKALATASLRQIAASTNVETAGLRLKRVMAKIAPEGRRTLLRLVENVASAAVKGYLNLG